MLDPVVPQLEREVDERVVVIPVRAGLKRLRDLHGGGLSGFRQGQGSAVQAPAPVVEYISPRARSVSIACASCGVHLTRAGSVSVANASCGVHLTCASCVSSANSG